MMKKKPVVVLLSCSLLATLSCTAIAKITPETHIIVTSQCALKKIQADYTLLSATKDFALIETNDNGVNQLIAVKNDRQSQCGGFMDVTDSYQSHNKKEPGIFLKKYTQTPQQLIKHDYKIQYQNEVNQLLTQLNPQDMWSDLTKLSSFSDRYSRSDTGVEAANWIKTQVETLAKNTGHHDVTVYLVPTGKYKQPSVVAKLGDSNEEGIVVGGHMDTLSADMMGNRPGADDDGSGSVTVLETARTILSSGLHFKKPIYFVWYSAEEMGLIGSQYVVKDFKKQNIPVAAVVQFDMTGFAYKNDPTIWLINDYVNKDLTAYLEALVKTYVKQPVKYTACHYACSDHATWYQEGFTSSMPFEASFGNDNPSIHTASDTMEKLSLSHMTDYAKLATAFAVELAEPIA